MLNAALHPSLVSCLFSERALAAAEVEGLDIALFNFKAVHAHFFFSTPDLQCQQISSCASLNYALPASPHHLFDVTTPYADLTRDLAERKY
jgi:hypothetical protein